MNALVVSEQVAAEGIGLGRVLWGLGRRSLPFPAGGSTPHVRRPAFNARKTARSTLNMRQLPQAPSHPAVRLAVDTLDAMDHAMDDAPPHPEES